MKGKHRAQDNGGDADPQQPREAVEQDIDDLLRKLSDERDALRDQLLRTMADFQNFRKRQDDQRKQLEVYATEKLVKALLPVIDNFERALASFDTGATAESMVEGLKAVDRQFRQILEAQGVTRIPAVGEEFDPEVHEALSMEPTEEHEDNKVIGEIEAGYKMGDRVLRPARVRVAKRP